MYQRGQGLNFDDLEGLTNEYLRTKTGLSD